MLVDPSMEKMLPKVDCAYELAVLVSKRTRQLVDGAQPMIGDKASNMVSLACREVAQGKVVRVKGMHDKEIVVPETKEARTKKREEQLAREEAERARQMEREMLLQAQLERKDEEPEEADEDRESEDPDVDNLFSVVDQFDDIDTTQTFEDEDAE